MEKKIKHTKIKLHHGIVTLSPLAKKIIDTPEFRRLHEIKQLGLVYRVFPPAKHSRGDHSLGVYYLVGRYLEYLCKYTPIDERTKEILKISGLVHDIGHNAFSHLFDHQFAKKLGLPDHEERGTKIFKDMVEKYKLDFSTQEVELICAIVTGKHCKPYPRWMFQIVCNSFFELDCDKYEYIVQDCFHTGVSVPIQLDRIFEESRISVDGDIIFNRKIYLQIYDIFMSRYRLHRCCYRSKAVVSCEIMVTKYLNLLFQIPEIIEILKKEEWSFFDDDILKFADKLLILKNVNIFGDSSWIVKNEEILKKCSAIKNDIDLRKLPKLISMTNVTDTSSDKKIEDDDPNYKNIVVSMGFCSSKTNPFDNILFFENDESGTIHHINFRDISKLLCHDVNEDIIFRYKL